MKTENSNKFEFGEIDVRQRILNWWCRLRGHPFQKRAIESLQNITVNGEFQLYYCKWRCMNCGDVSTKELEWWSHEDVHENIITTPILDGKNENRVVDR